MSEPSFSELGVHEEATLLPWYLTGKLPDGERDRVRRHLESCAVCRREFEDLKLQREQLTAAYSFEPSPARDLFPAMMAGVKRSNPTPTYATQPTGVGARIEQWFRSLLAPRWAPAFATLLIALQAGVLWWATARPPAGEVIERSIQPAVTRFEVMFRANATEAQIRRALEAVHGRILDGPRPNGTYVIQVPGTDTATLDRTLGALRAHADTIDRADRLGP